MNTFYDLDKKIIGMFMAGVAWTKPGRTRLGSYDEHIEPGYIYDNDGKEIAIFDKGVVSNLDGQVIGEYKDKSIYIDGNKVGSYIANDFAAAASVALLFSKL